MKDIAERTQETYNKQGEQFDKERPKMLIEKKWLERFEELLPNGAHVLDAGCGAGEPIAQYFIDKGTKLTGIDFSSTMIGLVKERFPINDWHMADIRGFNFSENFHGIIGWHSFFHLTKEDQLKALKCFADHLLPGGALMLTVAPKEGEELGHVCGTKVYHASFSPKGYTKALMALGLKVIDFVPEDPDCYGSSILLAQKVS